MNQKERLDYLIEAFKEDSGEYKNLKVPVDTDGKKRILRSLMNIRMPREMNTEVLKIQDEYLRGAINENGIVNISDIDKAEDSISIWQGDITRLKVDAIVNAANSQMLGCFIPMHTCIDRNECNKKMNRLKICYGRDYEQPTAIPMLTDAYNLPAKKIVHIVGPIVQGRLSKRNEEDLKNCYKNTLDLCVENGLRSVAFCCISTGVFHFPNKRAAEIAVATVREWLKENQGKMDLVIFNVFKDEDKKHYEKEISV